VKRLVLVAAALAAAGSVTALAAIPPSKVRPPTPSTTTKPPAPTTPTQSTPTPTEPACPKWNPPNVLRLAGGTPQTAQLGKAFPTSLQVVLANTNGCPVTSVVAGTPITFTAPSSGPSGTFSTSGTSSVIVGVDADGRASAPTFTANSLAGGYTVVATSDLGSVGFFLVNTATGVAVSIASTGGAGQAAAVDTRYAQPLQARVLDANGQPVVGVSVSFALGSGPYGASAAFLGGGAQATALTDASGVATSPPLVANATPGRFTGTASTSGLAAVVTFDLDNHAAGTAVRTPNRAQAATVGTRYAEPLRAQVVDADGKPVEGVTVTFTLAQSSGGAGASFVGGGTQATAVTDTSGRAVSPRLLANSTPGAFAGSANAAGKVVSYSLRNLAGRLRVTAPARTASVGGRYRPLQVRAADAGGRPLAGIAVTFAIGKSTAGASASFPDGSAQAVETTDATGRAVSPPLLANTTVGRFAATASVGTGTKPVEFALRNVAARAASIAAGAASGQSTAVGSRFPIRFGVTVTDADGNPVAGALVVFTAPARGASGGFAHGRVVRTRTDVKGIAVAPPFRANRRAGGYAVTARVAGTSVHAAFALVNTPR
jgi:protocatechuate 3,4-dioxygenase beta subunit